MGEMMDSDIDVLGGFSPESILGGLTPICKVGGAPAPPQQETLFSVPPPPRPNYWRIEWRWKAEIQSALAGVIDASVLPANDWNVHCNSPLHTNPTLALTEV